jgi:multidrug efflux system membrane fusion protein
MTVKPRIDGQLMSVSFKEGGVVEAGQVLAKIDSRPYEIQLAETEAQYASQEKIALRAPAGEYEAVMNIAQANVDRAKLQLSYTQLTAPITGVAGLRLIDPGNVVHTNDALVIITQLEPIVVLFTIPETEIPRVAARVRAGATLAVEAWNQDNSAKG